MKILQLKITLKDIKPPVWRRILVKEDITFYKLNTIIQYLMGWSGYHLYEFRVGDMDSSIFTILAIIGNTTSLLKKCLNHKKV
ncbi:hypothetical protein ATZ99_21370 [Thermovenabulum gondwanense]|uniref:Plasmid pRiA4b Orf3-like domain-containing protein n=1 Tax=Thermovenabulum gondwanense TaxID=520767 RepID=A0A162M5A6_9FIRM|nr:hypothetical protein ATZ99_21370 [Thermovenabulum gondwanense]